MSADPNKKGLAWQLDCMKIPLKIYGVTPIAHITRQDLHLIMEAMSAQPVKMLTVRIRMSILRAVLYWASEHDYCERISFPNLPRAQAKQFIPPTPAELAAMWEVAPPHIRRVILIGAQCGVRIGPSELFRLQ